jgi:hypothetical protein
MLEMMSARLDLHNLYLVNATERLANRSPREIRVARMLSPYRDYLQQDVQFDDSTASPPCGTSGDRRQRARTIFQAGVFF